MDFSDNEELPFVQAAFRNFQSPALRKMDSRDTDTAQDDVEAESIQRENESSDKQENNESKNQIMAKTSDFLLGKSVDVMGFKKKRRVAKGKKGSLDEATYDEQIRKRARKELEALEKENSIGNGNSSSNSNETEESSLKGIPVHPLFARVLKTHQKKGVSFMWNHIMRNNGCILADYMGLGKTLQVITVLTAFLSNFSHEEEGSPGRKVTALIIAPTSVVPNWKSEIYKWLDNEEGASTLQKLNLIILDSKLASNAAQRLQVVMQWQSEGGILVVGYELFRMLTTLSDPAERALNALNALRHELKHNRGTPNEKNLISLLQKKERSFKKYFEEIRMFELICASPGPSLVVVDEGHRLRKSTSQLVKSITHMKSRRRLILTGYPLQNHLSEYYCMVNFARPGYLGSASDFKNRFVVPIENGQAADSDESDVVFARERTFVLNQLLNPIVLRRDSSLLAKELPPKYEWVLRCRLSTIQAQLYRAMVRDRVRDAEIFGCSRNGGIIAAYHHSLSVVNHPDILATKLEQMSEKPNVLQPFSFTLTVQFYENRIGIHLHTLCEIHRADGESVIQRTVVVGKIHNPTLQGRVLIGDEILSVEGIETSDIAEIRRMIASIRKGSSVITIKFRRFHPDSPEHKFIMTNLREVENPSPIVNGSESDVGMLVTTPSEGVGNMKNGSSSTGREQEQISLDDSELFQNMHNIEGRCSEAADVELVESSMSQETHAFKWAVPLMKEYVAGAVLSQSGKMAVLFDILRRSRENGDKVLVFSQSVQTLNVIQSIIVKHNIEVDEYRKRCQEQWNTNDSNEDTNNFIQSQEAATDECPYIPNTKCNFLRLDGTTQQTRRIELINQFNNLPLEEMALFLLSTKAAGEGLNLHSANRVVMFDCCWNPCLDHEAMCRSYRFGQKKPVYVYRLIAAGTMERTIFDQQTRKEALTQRVIDARATKRQVTAKDLRDFFNLKRFNRSQKRVLSLSEMLTDENETRCNKNNNVDANISINDSDNDNRTTTSATEKQKFENGNSMEEPFELETKKRKYEALRNDSVLISVLKSPDETIVDFSLEDLLLNEDEAERCTDEEKDRALKAFKKQVALEEQLKQKGYGAAAAASAAASMLMSQSYQIHNGSPSQSQAKATAGTTSTPMPISVPQVNGLFKGLNYLVLSRRMEDQTFKVVCSLLRQNGGNRVMEITPTTHVVISSWSQSQLQNWLKTRNTNWIERYGPQPDGDPLRPVFRDTSWVINCVRHEKLLDPTQIPQKKITEGSSSSPGEPNDTLGLEDDSATAVVTDMAISTSQPEGNLRLGGGSADEPIALD